MTLPFTPVPKPVRRIDPAYRAWIAEQPCVVPTYATRPGTPCGPKPDREAIECCHLKTRGAFGEDRENCFPACPTHHDEQEGRTVAFKARYGIPLPQLVLAYDADYEAQVHSLSQEQAP